MKKSGILNSDISRVLSYLRHTDLICISDCGLPVADDVEVIDLALKKDLPSFIDVLDVIIDDVKCEKYFLASEIKNDNKLVFSQISKRLTQIPVDFLSHEEFKKKVSNCKVVIRTGEMSPYANIILQSGCIF